ncbi:MAG: hydrolase, partial [Spirochaetota bacterium]
KLHDHGAIKPGNVADFIVISRIEDNPYSAVVNAQLEDIALVVINGKPMYGDSSYKKLFDHNKVKYQEIILRNRHKLVVGDLLGLLRRISKAVGYKKEFPFIPVEFDI